MLHERILCTCTQAVKLAAVCFLLLVADACSKAYVQPDSGPRAKLTVVTQETRGTVGYMTPQECRQRSGAHPIFELDAKSPTSEIYLPANQDAVLAYEYDQPEHLGPVGPLLHCHVAVAFHPREGESYVLTVSGVETCAINVQDAEGKSVPGVQFAAGRCDTLPPALWPGFPPP